MANGDLYGPSLYRPPLVSPWFVHPVVGALLIALGAGGFAYASLTSPLIGLGLLYAIMFVIVTWRWPEIALVLTVALSPFQQDLSIGAPVRFSIAEINMALTFPIFLLRNCVLRIPIRIGPLFWPLAAWFALCILASLPNWSKTTTVSIAQMALYLVIAVMMFSSFARKIEYLLWPLRVLVVVCTGLALLVLATGSGYLFGLHKNGTGGSLACGLIVCGEFYFAATDQKRRRRYAIAGAIIAMGLISTLSRGGWIGAFMGLVTIIAMRRQYALLVRLSVLMAPVILIAWFMLPQEHREYATSLDPNRYNIQARYDMLAFANSHFQSSPIWGVGVGLRKQYDATNVAMLTLAETGIIGLALLLYLHAVVLNMVRHTVKHLPRSHRFYSLCALAAALVVARLMHGMVDHFWGRGPITICWATVGMAVAVYYHVCARKPASHEATP